MSRIVDAEVQLLASHSRELHNEYAEDQSAWEGSPFAWIKTCPSRQVGAIGEKLVSKYLLSKGFEVRPPPDSEADRLIDGIRTEIKCSTLWKNGTYTFQQLRDQNYEFVICLGISPFDVHCWVLPKKVVMQQWASGGIKSQHGGRSGRDTAWLQVSPDNVPEWLQARGGRLSKAIPLIAYLTQRGSLA